MPPQLANETSGWEDFPPEVDVLWEDIPLTAYSLACIQQSMQNRYADTGEVISVHEPSWYSQPYGGCLVAQT